MSKPSLSELSKAAVIADRLTSDFKTLIKVLGEPSSGVNAIADGLFSLSNDLKSKIDGRPQPLDYSKDCEGRERFCHTAELRQELEQDRRDLSTWAECVNPGAEDKALIAGREFNQNELIALKAWIDAVLAWHEKMRGKR